MRRDSSGPRTRSVPEDPFDGRDQALDRVGRATADTRRPCARASRAVTGPMRTTFGFPRTTPIAPTNPRTVEALVNVMASTPSVPERRPRIGGQRPCHARPVRVDADSATSPSPPARPPGRRARCRPARRGPALSPRGKARANPAVVNVGGHEVGAPPRPARGTPRPCPSPIAATFARTSDGESSRDASISTVARLVSVIHANRPADRSRSAVGERRRIASARSRWPAPRSRVAPRRRSRRTSSTD